jgi:hyaluronan synthase
MYTSQSYASYPLAISKENKSSSSLSYKFFLIIQGLLILILIVWLKSTSAADFYKDPLLLAYTLFITTFELSRLVAATFFRGMSKNVLSKGDSIYYEPTVSFVIPCKNEEKAIKRTISKCFEADYPKEKLEVIVINDGSTDNTLKELRSLQKKYPSLIVVDWKINKGKREGMAEGFRRAKGEIVVQLDSDSYIIPETFRKLIEPFANPEIGAVCAHADPENADKNILTKVQAAYYFMSFRILKAAESSFAAVFCCSGCSSAYRRSLIVPILNMWLKEKFLGLPVTWGDDRALTNWVLRQKYKTIYTDEARALTICPDKWKTFFKQQVRWKKGWFVNSVFASKFIYKTRPFVAFTYFFPLIFVTLMTPFMAARAFFYNSLVRGIYPVYYVLGILLMAFLIVTFYRYVSRENHYWPYLFVWSGINMIVLSYVLFYSLLTIQNRKWGTR